MKDPLLLVEELGGSRMEKLKTGETRETRNGRILLRQGILKYQVKSPLQQPPPMFMQLIK